MCSVLLDNLSMDDAVKLFIAHKIFSEADAAVISFAPSEHLKNLFLVGYLWNLKLSAWSVIFDELINTESMRRVGYQLIESTYDDYYLLTV